MADTFVISGLTQKRAEILGVALDLEARARKVRQDLAHIDAVIVLFDPTAKPQAIKAKRPVDSTGFFGNGERSRRIREALRGASAPLSAEEIVLPIMAEKGLDPDDRKLRGKLICAVLNALAHMLARGHVQKVGHGMGARWKAPEH
jgi:hypothetical protein